MGMTYLFKKFCREIFHENGSQVLSLTIIVSIGIACFIGFVKTAVDLESTFAHYYSSANLEDIEVSGLFSSKRVRQIKNLPGVDELEQNYDYRASRKNTNLLVSGYAKDQRINRPTLLAGRYPQKDGVLVDHLYLKKNKLKLGDQVKLVVNGLKVKGKISGSIRSPKYLYLTENAAEPVPNHRKYGYVMLPNAKLKRLGLPVNSLAITVDKPDQRKRVASQIRKIDRNVYVLKRQDLMSYNMIHSKLETIKNIAVAISSVFILLTVAITLISYAKQVSNKRPEIATLKALGVAKSEILAYLFFPGMVTAVIGTIIGSLVGMLVFPRIITKTLATLFDFPPAVHGNYAFLAVGALVVVLVVELLALMINAVKLLNESAAATMRPAVSATRANTFLAQIPMLWRHFSFKTKLLVRNIASGRVKFLFSALALAFCVTMLISSFGLKYAFGDIEKTEFQDIRKYDISANLDTKKSAAVKVSGDLGVVYADNYSIVPAKVGDTDTHLNVVNQKTQAIHLPADDKTPLDFDHLRGVYLSAKRARRLGLGKGSSVDIRVFNHNKYQQLKTKIRGIYTSYTSQGFYTTYDYLKSRGMNVSVQTKFIKARHVKEEQGWLNKNSLIKNVSLKSKQKRSYQQASKSVNAILVLIVLIAALLLFAVIYNISTINIAERKRDIATEKVLGLSSLDINKLLLGENALLVVVATVIGTLISPWIYNLLGESIASDDMSFPAQFNLICIPISLALNGFE